MIISAARQSTQAPAARSRSSATGKKEITRALSACPPSVASEAAASVIDEPGYVNVWTGASANACTSADIRPQLAIRHWAPFPEDYGEGGMMAVSEQYAGFWAGKNYTTTQLGEPEIPTF
jgi:hypothetical protein